MDKVLLVTEDKNLVDTITNAFDREDVELFVARDQVEAMLFLDRDACDVVLLEVVGENPLGLWFCPVIRRNWDVGLFLLMHPESLEHVVLGYQMGADGYMNVEHLGDRELVARVSGLARRVRMYRGARQSADAVPAWPMGSAQTSG